MLRCLGAKTQDQSYLSIINSNNFIQPFNFKVITAIMLRSARTAKKKTNKTFAKLTLLIIFEKS